MHISLNLEFTDEEAKKYVEDIGRRWTLNFIHDVMSHIGGIKLDPALSSLLAQVARGAADAFGVSPVEQPRSRAYASTEEGRCSRMEASQFSEEGWLCHLCSHFNAGHRAVCRNCTHLRCDSNHGDVSRDTTSPPDHTQ